jgi:hypothetical protein
LTTDWPGGGTAPADGTVTIDGSSLNLSKSYVLTGLNFSLDGNSTFNGTPSKKVDVGVYNFNVNGNPTDLLCVELTQGSGNAAYDFKDVSGLAGWLTQQMSSVTDDTHGAALALATWEIAYDSKQYNGAGAPGLNLSTGNFQYKSAGAVLTDANAYLAEFAADATATSYEYYRNPVGGGTLCGYQDFIGVSKTSTGTPGVPGPLAAVPFIAGFLRAFLKRKK